MSLHDRIGGHKKAANRYKGQLHAALARVKRLTPKVDEQTRRLLAQGFVVEDGALGLCEQGKYGRAVADLAASDSRDGRLASDILARLIKEGKVLAQLVA